MVILILEGRKGKERKGKGKGMGKGENKGKKGEWMVTSRRRKKQWDGKWGLWP